jgi:hypothetical protein
VRWVAPVAAVVTLIPLAMACGGGGSFPEPAECITPPPLPTSSSNPGVTSRTAYETTLLDGVRRLQSYADDFRGKYPSGNFSRQQQFRVDFADYADRTRCLATYLRDLPPLDAENGQPDEALDAVLVDLLEHTEFGREAVRSRNVSEWRDWRDSVDAQINAVRAAVRAIDI